MGREVRKVPPNWEHPKTKLYADGYGYQPMYDRTFAAAVAEWKAGFAKWEEGNRPEDCEDEYWEYEGAPPEREYYRPWSDEEATWFQVWETVSEGTPVTPPFATREELVAHLVANGDDWDQKRGDGGWSRAAAEKFVGEGWAPSMISVTGSGGGIFTPRDGYSL